MHILLLIYAIRRYKRMTNNKWEMNDAVTKVSIYCTRQSSSLHKEEFEEYGGFRDELELELGHGFGRAKTNVQVEKHPIQCNPRPTEATGHLQP